MNNVFVRTLVFQTVTVLILTVVKVDCDVPATLLMQEVVVNG